MILSLDGRLQSPKLDTLEKFGELNSSQNKIVKILKVSEMRQSLHNTIDISDKLASLKKNIQVGLYMLRESLWVIFRL